LPGGQNNLMAMEKVLLGGAFNILHPGHVKLLKAAKRLGYLVVVVASDQTVRKSKGFLLATAKDRAMMVRCLGIADKVVIGHRSDFLLTVKKVRPTIVALGYDQSLGTQLARRLKQMGIRIVIMEKYGGYSTRAILRKAKA